VIGPEDLRQAAELRHVTGFAAFVIRCEAAVIRGMPVLRRDDELEVLLHPIGDRHDVVAMRDRQRAGGHEVVLDVDED